MLLRRHDDPVAGPDVVEEEVAEGVERALAQFGGDGEQAAVDLRARRRGRERARVAARAADAVEEPRTPPRRGGARQHRVPRRRLGRADEAGEVIDVVEPIRARLAVGLGGVVAEVRDLVREQAARDPHLVEVGVPRERQQARVLILPAEAPDPGLPRGLDDRDDEGLSVDAAVSLPLLPAREVEQRLVGHALDEPVAQEIERDPRRADGLAVGHALVDLGVGGGRARADRAIVDERAPGDDHGAARDRDLGVLERAVGTAVADAQLGDLARAARGRVLVALAARLGVVERAQPVLDGLELVEDLAVGAVGRLAHQAVAEIVEARRGLAPRSHERGHREQDDSRCEPAPHDRLLSSVKGGSRRAHRPAPTSRRPGV